MRAGRRLTAAATATIALALPATGEARPTEVSVVSSPSTPVFVREAPNRFTVGGFVMTSSGANIADCANVALPSGTVVIDAVYAAGYFTEHTAWLSVPFGGYGPIPFHINLLQLRNNPAGGQDYGGYIAPLLTIAETTTPATGTAYRNAGAPVQLCGSDPFSGGAAVYFSVSGYRL